MTMTPTKPATVYRATALAGTAMSLYALRDDGAVFVLLQRGTLTHAGEVDEPRWARCPAVPDTIADFEERLPSKPAPPPLRG